MSVTAPRSYMTEQLLRDGGSICIRAIRPDDTPRLLALFEHLSSRSVYFRFFQAKQRLTDEELRAFTELDFVHNVAWWPRSGTAMLSTSSVSAVWPP